MTEWFRDERPCSTIAVDDRAVQYGDGLFETVAIRDGEPRLWDYHVERLQTSAAPLGRDEAGVKGGPYGVAAGRGPGQAGETRSQAKNG